MITHTRTVTILKEIDTNL